MARGLDRAGGRLHGIARGDPLLEPSLFRNPSFSAGAVFAAVYFAGFTSIFFTMSILWQEGLSHDALTTGLVIAPFSVGSLLSSANSDKLSARLGRTVIVVGSLVVLVGLAATATAIHLMAPELDGWVLVAPLFVAGLGSGMIIAPNTDFVLKAVPPRDAGTASGILGTFQRTGTAIGIAVIGTVLFGTLKIHPGPHAVASAFSHSAELALWVNLGIVAVNLLLALATRAFLPARPAVPGGPPRSS
jgi:MFS family permease